MFRLRKNKISNFVTEKLAKNTEIGYKRKKKKT